METGSFKERGAAYALKRLSKEKKKIGVIAASAGNHALALAYWGKRLGIPVTVIMPTIAPLTKIQRCKVYGANVFVFGDDIFEAKRRAEELQKEHNYTYINGFDDLDILTGAGTCGLEIMRDHKDVDAIIVPIGGGGLVAGMSLAVKSTNDDLNRDRNNSERKEVQIIGVEPLGCASFIAALKAGKPVEVDLKPTLADGLAVKKVGSTAFEIARHYVDKVVAVGDKYTALAVLRMLEEEKTLTEGAGSQSLAAMLAPNVLPELKGKKVVLCICGGNIDVQVLSKVLGRGLYVDNRLVRVEVLIDDVPGGLGRFSTLIGQVGASIKELTQIRGFTDIQACTVNCTIETRDKRHSLELLSHLYKDYSVLSCSVSETIANEAKLLAEKKKMSFVEKSV
eukprot:CAMPEP_0168602700 /NCGR_PEP_ID=MMETSP0420-20121227/14265_1 /TAXON_ID=498008 /ORGANISM="Pessonella sp." /LENGTH=394 /DNA_ID=CAMNT_0008641491 /DNA_START=151 /DNA_END=1332 /DNA_ORIENTATION=-